MTSPALAGDRYRVRVNIPRALACSKGLVNPVKNHEQFLELVFALSGPGFQRSYERFLESSDGRRLLRERPNVVEALTDTERLQACPKGSLGHAYLDFMSQNRLDAGLYDGTYHDLPAIAERLGWDDDFHYVVHRGIALHDVMHVLGGYGPDVGGEFGVIGFTHGQVDGWVTGGTIAVIMLAPVGVPRRDRLRYWRESVARGRRADVLFAVPYEAMLNDPIDEVRRRLGIVDDALAHPAGHIYSTFQFGSSKTRVMDEAFEPYRYDPARDVSVG